MKIYKLLLLVCVLYIFTGCDTVVYVHRDMAGEQSTWGKSQIYRMWSNGWEKQNISNRERDEYSPDIHHVTKKIVFVANGKLFTMDIDGSNVHAVPNSPADVDSPRWARRDDSQSDHIAFIYPVSTMQSAVYLIYPDGSGLTKVTNPALTERDEAVETLGGKYIIYSRYDSVTQDRDLYLKYIFDNRPAVRITTTTDRSETRPVISHSGQLLAYRSTGVDFTDRVYVAKISDQLTGITLTHTIDLQPPATINISGIGFSFSDEELFVSAPSTDVPGNLIDRQHEIFKVRLDGSHQLRLTSNADADARPCAISRWGKLRQKQ